VIQDSLNYCAAWIFQAVFPDELKQERFDAVLLKIENGTLTRSNFSTKERSAF
jgi:hypothetical protein